MSRRAWWGAVLVALLIFLSVFIWSTIKDPANAYQDNNTKAKVSQGEWFSLKAGMSRHEVETILDGPGHAGQQHTRWYRWAYGAPKFIRVVVSYDHNVMTNAFLVAKKVNQGTFDVPLVQNEKTNGDDTRGCATVGEWNALQPGMTRHEVYTIMDGQGQLSEPQVRKWKVCDGILKPGKTAWVSVWFKDQVAYTIYWIQLSK